MLTNKQSLLLSGILILGFFILGIIDLSITNSNILDNLIVKIVFGSLFLLIIINLFLDKKENDDDLEKIKKKEDNYFK